MLFAEPNVFSVTRLTVPSSAWIYPSSSPFSCWRFFFFVEVITTRRRRESSRQVNRDADTQRYDITQITLSSFFRVRRFFVGSFRVATGLALVRSYEYESILTQEFYKNSRRSCFDSLEKYVNRNLFVYFRNRRFRHIFDRRNDFDKISVRRIVKTFFSIIKYSLNREAIIFYDKKFSNRFLEKLNFK